MLTRCWSRPSEAKPGVAKFMRPLLEHLSELRDLDLRFTDVTDQGLTHLKGLTQLATLRVGTSECQVNASKLTMDAVAELQKDLPHTTIYFYGPDPLARGERLRS